MHDTRDRLGEYLQRHWMCVLSTRATSGTWAAPVRYLVRPGAGGAEALAVTCLVPHWADAAFNLEQDPQVLLIVPEACATGLRWLEYRGAARPVSTPDWVALLPSGAARPWPGGHYLTVRVTPERIDLIDETRGWGARETLEL